MQTIYFFIRLTVLLLFSILFINRANALGIDSTRTEKSIIVSYWGTLNNNPGIKLGVEKNLLLTSKYKVNGSVSLLLNRKPNIYTSAGIMLGNTLRRTGKRGFYFEHGINYGYLGSYYDFDVYRTNAEGNIINVGRKWFNSVILGYSLGVGYDFSKRTNTNIQIFIKPGVYYRFPNNDNIFFLNNYSVEMGFAIRPKWLNKNNPKI